MDTQQGKIPWGGLPKPPPSISACFKHIKKLGTEYGNWLESRLQHWETEGKRLLAENPNWRSKLEDPTVAAVLPPTYNPFLHKALLRAAGADDTIVDEILKWVRMAGSGAPTGFFDTLPSAEYEDFKRFDDELVKAIWKSCSANANRRKDNRAS